MKIFSILIIFLQFIFSLQQSQKLQHLVCNFNFYGVHYCCEIKFANISSLSGRVTFFGDHPNGFSNNNVEVLRTGSVTEASTFIHYLPNHIFDTFPNLIELSLWNVDLKSLDLKNVEKFKDLYIYNSSLPEIPSQAFKNFTSLIYLQFMHLENAKTFEDSFHGLTNLESINFGANPEMKIFNNSFIDSSKVKYFSFSYPGSIEAGALSHMKDLRSITMIYLGLNFAFFETLLNDLRELTIINISGNDLSEANFTFFTQFKHLEQFMISNCKVKSFSAGSFDGLSELRLISVSGNQIKSFESDSFRGLTSVTDFWLSIGDIEDLNSLPFTHMVNILSLYLSDNKMKVLPSNLFENNRNLKFLDLSSCKIETIEENVFNNLRNLFRINLSNNLLSSLTGATFTNLTSLMYLHLANNRIQTLNLKPFDNLYSLALFDIQYNEIQQIDPEFFSRFFSLYDFFAIGNICIDSDVIDVKKIDFDNENVFSLCMNNWRNEQTDTTENLLIPSTEDVVVLPSTHSTISIETETEATESSIATETTQIFTTSDFTTEEFKTSEDQEIPTEFPTFPTKFKFWIIFMIVLTSFVVGTAVIGLIIWIVINRWYQKLFNMVCEKLKLRRRNNNYFRVEAWCFEMAEIENNNESNI